MSQKEMNASTVSVVHPICCGLDVHKMTISACLLASGSDGHEVREVADFETFTDDIVRLKEWLLDRQCAVVAMESTGQYWTPVHNVLEKYFTVVLVNAKHIKNVPGRKTDISDSKWLAGLLRHGLVKGGFIPPKHQRQWRDLTRMRKNYVKTVGDFKRRVHKLFQTANIKIDSVVSDLFGQTGRNLIRLMCASNSNPTLQEVKDCLRGTLTEKSTELHRSVQGFFEQHHRDILALLLETIDKLEQQIGLIDVRIEQSMKNHQDTLDRIKQIPGISNLTAQAILSEIGADLNAFPKPTSLTSWCGLCPGNNESAGKRRSGKSPIHKNHLKTIMVEVAWGAINKKGSYYKAKYYALRARLGPKKAIIAVAHRILKALYHVIKEKTSYRDLGERYLLEKNKASKLNYLQQQAKLLGYQLKPLNVINSESL
jgi:transposase